MAITLAQAELAQRLRDQEATIRALRHEVHEKVEVIHRQDKILSDIAEYASTFGRELNRRLGNTPERCGAIKFTCRCSQDVGHSGPHLSSGETYTMSWE